ncbi:MAG: NirA family protein [Opitutales bacterium]
MGADLSSSGSFTDPQKQYLQGFFAGVGQRSLVPYVGTGADGRLTHDPAQGGDNAAVETVHGVPIDDLCKEEQIKHEQHGLDIWDTLLDSATRDRFPEGGDVFRYKFHGLFYVKPAQDSLMLRCRIPGCALRAEQFEAIGEIAEKWGGGYCHVTTRGNIQVREIQARDSLDVLLRLREAGLTSQGSGADNVRNVTASPTSGFDPDEVYDVLPLARAMHHYILNTRELYDLPRKFNIAFDNGGAISVCADTNDIAFYAVRVRAAADAPMEVFFRVQLCGITGHRQFASDCGLLLKPEECVAVAAAMLRVFSENGDRTNRKKARLKYLIDKWGTERFLEETQKKLAFELRRGALEDCEARRKVEHHGHIGVYPQSQDGLAYVGVCVPVGRLTVAQVRGLSQLAREFGQGEVRLTVWQNVLMPHVPEARVDALVEALDALGLSVEANPISNGLVACTGNQGCKFSSTDTKRHAIELGAYLKERLSLDTPLNIHFTGCPHSCAQHYIGDIGLIGVKVKEGERSIEGYNIVLGGGVDDRQAIAREVFSAVPFSKVPALLESVLRAYLSERAPSEPFHTFTRRHSEAELDALFASALSA